MDREDGDAILSSTCFRLGVMGSQITRSFSQRSGHPGRTHQQVGLLAVVDAGLASSQREIATRLDIAPSLVVSLVDQLVDIGAVHRTRSTKDRRVHAIEITNEGRRMLRLAAGIVEKLDADLQGHLSPTDQSALDSLLPTLSRAVEAADEKRE